VRQDCIEICSAAMEKHVDNEPVEILEKAKTTFIVGFKYQPEKNFNFLAKNNNNRGID
jgi:hypothetical protein